MASHRSGGPPSLMDDVADFVSDDGEEDGDILPSSRIVICTRIASTVVEVAEDAVVSVAWAVGWACVVVEVAMVECEDEVAKAVDSFLEGVHAVAVDAEIISSVIVSTTISIDRTTILAVVHHRRCSAATKSIHSNPDRSTATVTVEDECHIHAVVVAAAAGIQDPNLVQPRVHRRCSTFRLTNRVPIPYRHSSLSKSKVQVDRCTCVHSVTERVLLGAPSANVDANKSTDSHKDSHGDNSSIRSGSGACARALVECV